MIENGEIWFEDIQFDVNKALYSTIIIGSSYLTPEYPKDLNYFTQFNNIKFSKTNSICSSQYNALKSNDVYNYFYTTGAYSNYQFLSIKYDTPLKKKYFEQSNEFKILKDSLQKIKQNNIFSLYIDVPNYTLEKEQFYDYPINCFNITHFNGGSVLEQLVAENFLLKKINMKAKFSSYLNKVALTFLSIPVDEKSALKIEENIKDVKLIIIFDHLSNNERIAFVNLKTFEVYYEKKY
ncbi:MAG: hypothetical protein HXX09_16385 [Bacteroidetes bacterium]|nr:hypothetical protein [Bacteroidota bacterium]